MDDATQKPGTCPTCRHAEHEGYICLNMASDYDCGCDKRPAKLADDATQKLVECVFCDKITQGTVEPTDSPHVVTFEPLNPVTPGHRLFVPRTHVEDAADAPAITGEAFAAAAEWAASLPDAFNLITSAGADATQTIRHLHVHLVPRRHGDGLLLPWSVAQRPPVSSEVREELDRVVREATAEYFREDLPEDGRDETDTIVDALLARFSVPSQPVYDEEKIARWLHEVPGLDWLATTPQELAADITAALRGGELTREETNGG